MVDSKSVAKSPVNNVIVDPWLWDLLQSRIIFFVFLVIGLQASFSSGLDKADRAVPLMTSATQTEKLLKGNDVEEEIFEEPEDEHEEQDDKQKDPDYEPESEFEPIAAEAVEKL